MESPWGTLFHSSNAWGLGFKTADQLYFKFEKVHIVFNLNISLNWHLGAQTYSCKKKRGYFLGGPVAKTPSTGGLGSIPWSGN